MPATSEAQANAAKMALAAKHGHVKPRKGGAVRSMMSMSDEQLREFFKVKKS